ncbi:MAG: tetratricopeptide repeat protein [Geminicoccaceae bacterium]
MRHIMAVLLSLLLPTAASAAGASDSPGKGRDLLASGRYEAALPYFQHDLELAEQRYGRDDPSVAIEVNNLAEVNRLAGRLKEAEKLYQRAIALDERAKPPNPVGLATSLNNLALVYRGQGLLDKAAALNARSLGMLEEALGPNSPDVARSLNNLATLYRLQGLPDRARPLQERAVAIAASSLGPRHPDTQQLRRNLAALDGGPRGPGTTASSAEKAVPLDADTVPTPRSKPGTTSGTTSGSGIYAVQLAAVQDPAEVAAEWKRFSRRYPQLKGLDLMSAAVEVAGKGTFYRVLAGPLSSQAEAATLCTQLRQAGGSCQVARR